MVICLYYTMCKYLICIFKIFPFFLFVLSSFYDFAFPKGILLHTCWIMKEFCHWCFITLIASLVNAWNYRQIFFKVISSFNTFHRTLHSGQDSSRSRPVLFWAGSSLSLPAGVAEQCRIMARVYQRMDNWIWHQDHQRLWILCPFPPLSR